MGFGAKWPEIKQSLLLEAANFGEYIGKKEPSILSTIKPRSNKFSGQGQRLGDRVQCHQTEATPSRQERMDRKVSAFASAGHQLGDTSGI